MLKRLVLTLALLLPMPAMASGTIPLSLSQQFDNSTHLPLAAGKLFTIQAGTTSTPQNAYQDSALTLPYPNPLTLDAGGRIPQLFFADGSIKIRLENSLGVQQVVQDNILVIGPSSGGGGGGTVDPTTILATGDVKVSYTTSTIPGWVRMNGRTIGSATSGATERANSDTQALFQFLWASDANLAVSGGRGASAAADWSANKTIALPDARNRAIAGLGDMGNSDAGLFSGVTFSSGTGTTLGATLGAAKNMMALANLPNYSPTVNGNGTLFTNQTTIVSWNSFAGGVTVNGSGGGVAFTGGTPNQIQASVNVNIGVNSINGGVSQTAMTTVSPLLLVTTYIKL
jgi:hypothetical protein